MKNIVIVLMCLICNVALAQTAGDFYKKAVVKYKMKDFGGAIVEYTRAIDLRDNSAQLYNNRGVCKYKMERYSEAIEDYKKAIISDSTFVQAHFNKGNSHLEINELDKALISYDKAIAIDSNYYKAYINRAKVYYLMKDFQSSAVDLTKIIDGNKSKNREKLYLERGNALFKLERYKEALEDYYNAVELNTNYYKGYINRGQCQLMLKDHKSAIDDFTLAMRLDPTGGEAYYYRGLAYVDQTSPMKAAKKERKTIRKFRENRRLMELACSDFEKAKSFNYGRSFEVSQTYCK